MGLLSEARIQDQLGKLTGWQLEGKEIAKRYQFKDFVRAMGFVNSVALLAEGIDHHPDIDIRWNKVKLTLTTHSAGGLTEKDFSLAALIDELPAS
ncbi:MAG: 4a-hydroxytetrahydrobiopterin dehydratase [Bacteroidota bacterium]